jgi:hypothetical protein
MVAQTSAVRMATWVTGTLPLTYDRLAELLDREGQLRDSYWIGRRGTYRDQAFILDRWSKRWVVCCTDRSEKTTSASTYLRTPHVVLFPLSCAVRRCFDLT